MILSISNSLVSGVVRGRGHVKRRGAVLYSISTPTPRCIALDRRVNSILLFRCGAWTGPRATRAATRTATGRATTAGGILKRAAGDHQPSEQDQIAFLRSLICAGACQNSVTCGTNQENSTKQFDPTLMAGATRAATRTATGRATTAGGILRPAAGTASE